MRCVCMRVLRSLHPQPFGMNVCKQLNLVTVVVVVAAVVAAATAAVVVVVDCWLRDPPTNQPASRLLFVSLFFSRSCSFSFLAPLCVCVSLNSSSLCLTILYSLGGCSHHIVVLCMRVCLCVCVQLSLLFKVFSIEPFGSMLYAP